MHRILRALGLAPVFVTTISAGPYSSSPSALGVADDLHAFPLSIPLLIVILLLVALLLSLVKVGLTVPFPAPTDSLLSTGLTTSLGSTKRENPLMTCFCHLGRSRCRYIVVGIS